MKTTFGLLIFGLITACSPLKTGGPDNYFELQKENGIIILNIHNNSDKDIIVLVNDNPKYYENYLLMKSNKTTSVMKLMVVDENDAEVNYIAKRNTIHFEDSDIYERYKNEIVKNKISVPNIKKIKHRENFVLKFHFNIENTDPYTGFSNRYNVVSGKKHFLKIKYDLDKKASDSLKQKGMPIYDESIVSNKIAIDIN